MTSAGTASALSSVVILDEICLPRSCADEWLRTWRSDYLPRAGQRGLELRAIWRGSTEVPEQSQIVICWSVPRVGRYWAARWQATDDPQVRRFWQTTDSIAISRERRVLEDSGTGLWLEH